MEFEVSMKTSSLVGLKDRGLGAGVNASKKVYVRIVKYVPILVFIKFVYRLILKKYDSSSLPIV